MKLRAVLLMLALLGVLFSAPQPLMAKMPPPVLSGGDLPYPVTLPFHDWEAYVTLRPFPERFATPPAVSGAVYRLTSWYWSDIAAWALDQEGRNEADYYPLSGSLRVQDGADALWFQLDPARQRLLARYLSLGRSRRIPSEPSILQVAAASTDEEAVTLEIGRFRESERTLVPAEVARTFWREARVTPVQAVMRSRTLMSGKGRLFDLFVRLPEGRVLTFWYDHEAGVLVDPKGIEAGWGQLDGYGIAPEVMQRLRDVAASAGVAYPSWERINDGVVWPWWEPAGGSGFAPAPEAPPANQGASSVIAPAVALATVVVMMAATLILVRGARAHRSQPPAR